jgi:hypothetical protein
MFVSIRCYFVHKAPARELAELVDHDFADRISAQPGFVSYEFLDGGEGEAMTISAFQEPVQAEDSRASTGRLWRNGYPNAVTEACKTVRTSASFTGRSSAAPTWLVTAPPRRYDCPAGCPKGKETLGAQSDAASTTRLAEAVAARHDPLAEHDPAPSPVNRASRTRRRC